MEQRTLGADGPPVSVIGLGLAALGRPGYINLGHGSDFADGRSVEAMRERSITYLDAARSYGRAEEFLGRWLRERAVAPSDVVVGSKWGYVYTADWQVDADQHEVKIHDLPTLDRQIGETQANLSGYLRLYQIHSATLDSGVLERADVLERLEALRNDGLVIGASTSGPNQAATIDRMLEIEVDGAPLFGAVQATWNLFEPSAGGALARAHQAGLGVIVKEAVANGRLTSRNAEIASVFADAAPGWSPDAVAIAAATRQPWASVVLSGAATIAQLTSNLRALDVPAAVVDGLVGKFAEEPEAYWSTRSALAWQ